MYNFYVKHQKNIKTLLLIIYDVIAVWFAGFLSLLLRFEFHIEKIPDIYLTNFHKYLPFALLVTLVIFSFNRLYKSLWIYAGLVEMQNILLACMESASVYFLGVHVVHFGETFLLPRSYYVMFFFFLLALTAGMRFAYRAVRLQFTSRERFMGESAVPAMIVGAGETGHAVIRDILSSASVHLDVRCIIDDDKRKIGSYISGIKVVGDRNFIPEAVKQFDIKEIIIAIPSASRSTIAELASIANSTGARLKITPSVSEMVNGHVSQTLLRDVSVEDLLGREPVRVDLESIAAYVRGKTVLVTGGGGSIGSELCRQIAGHSPKRLIVVDIYENNAYAIEQELKMTHPELDFIAIISSVRDRDKIDQIFAKYKPDLVYHAAAHKHVPLMETSPAEAIKNNVFGTLNTVKAADKYGTKRFVLISTDKAVNPTSVMGATKRICEMIIQTFGRHSKTEFVAVRFGNVLGSSGSVIPLFKKQIAAGGPVTVTHPDIIRFFMTIPEAVSLVLQAGAYAKGGEIYILNMGQPVRIYDLATNLIRLSGLEPGKDIEIKFTGLRPGEKLYEEYLMDEEGMQDTANSLIHIGHPISIDEDRFKEELVSLYDFVYTNPSPERVREVIKDIVPTYHHPDN